MTRSIATVLLVGLSLANFAAAQEAPPLDDAKLARLIKQLDAEDFGEREAATKALIELGDQAIPALEALVADKSLPERRLRAEQALKAIERAGLMRSAVKLSDFVAEATNSGRGKLDQEKLQTLLDRLAFVLTKEVGTEVALPVRLEDLGKPMPGRVGIDRAALYTFRSGKVSHLHNSIVIADGVAQVSHAHNSIIIAGVAAEVSHCTGCIIIAGQNISVGHDQGASVMLSGGDLRLSFSQKTILGAAGSLDVSHHSGSVLLNREAPPGRDIRLPPDAPPELLERFKPSRAVKTDLLVLKVDPPENPLAELVSVSTVVEDRLIVYRRAKNGGEYVVRKGEDLKTPDGEVIAELKGWKLEFIGGTYAVFRNGDDHVVLRTSDAVR